MLGSLAILGLRKDWLRADLECFGHRLLMDRIRPGGFSRDLDAMGYTKLSREETDMAREVAELKATYAVMACTQHNGDVAARVAVRFDECLALLRLIDVLLGSLPDGPMSAPVAIAGGQRSR